MKDHIYYNACAVCGSQNIIDVLKAKDYTVSKEEFIISQCRECSFRFTQNAPGPHKIGSYYKSEDYISHTNQSKGLIEKLYHLVRSGTLSSKKKLVQRITKKQTGNLLDIGAGTGYFAAFMKNNGWNVTGLEPDETARNNAYTLNNITLEDTEHFFRFEPATYDCITLWHVLEHIHELYAFIKQFHQLLKPDGKLIIAVPNFQSYDAMHYHEHWAAYDVPRHLWHFSPYSIEMLFNQFGFQLIDKHPMWFDSFYVSMLSEKYKTGKTNYFSAVISGCKSNLKARKNIDKCSSIIYCFEKSN